MPTEETREVTYGEKAVGLAFNPSQDENVKKCKETYAIIIDALNTLRADTDSGEKKRLYSIAITEAQAAQMRAVKAITRKD